MNLPLHDWLRRIDSEYLSSFIQDGGGSVKFAVTPEDLKPALYETVENRGKEQDYVVVKLDASDMRIHMPQDIFFEMAKQVDWRHLARRLLLRLAREIGYRVDTIDPHQTDNIFKAMGDVNDLELESVLQELRPQLENKVTKKYRMTKDFRVAMTHLCRYENNRGNQSYEGQPLIDWLTGNAKLGAVRPFSIYTSINRKTARYFIESALYYFQYAGYAGTVILLDNSRVTLARNPVDGLRYYTRSMTTDHYELLRQFIDRTEHLVGTLLVVVTANAFLEQDARSRGFGIYPALMTRVMDDVRDKNLVNPIAPLVQLSHEGTNPYGY